MQRNISALVAVTADFLARAAGNTNGDVNSEGYDDQNSPNDSNNVELASILGSVLCSRNISPT